MQQVPDAQAKAQRAAERALSSQVAWGVVGLHVAVISVVGWYWFFAPPPFTDFDWVVD